MEQPIPIDPARLKNILGGAKAIMDKVTTGDYSTGNVDGRALNEEGVQQMMAEGITRPQQNVQQAVAPQMQANQPLYKNMETSNMPTAIKEAMMQTPIAQANGMAGHTFNLEDVQDIIPQQNRAQQYPQTPNTNPQPVYEQQGIGQNTNGTFTVSEAALRGIVNDMLLEFMTKTFTQSLSEDVIKKTLNTLIKEGKIGVKKKVQTKRVVRT